MRAGTGAAAGAGAGAAARTGAGGGAVATGAAVGAGCTRFGLRYTCTVRRTTRVRTSGGGAAATAARVRSGAQLGRDGGPGEAADAQEQGGDGQLGDGGQHEGLPGVGGRAPEVAPGRTKQQASAGKAHAKTRSAFGKVRRSASIGVLRRRGCRVAFGTVRSAGDRPDRVGPVPAEGPLKRAISGRMLLLFVVGDVLGAGIYALVGVVGGRVGGAIWTAFVVALGLALFTAFAYAELVTKYPKAAGAALYVNQASGGPFVTFMVAFAVMCSGLTSAAALSRALGGDYLSVFVELPAVPITLVFITAVALVNFRGISESVHLNVALTSIELSGLLLVVVIGLAAIADGGPSIDAGPVLEFKAGVGVVPAIVGGAGLAFFALIGFEDSVDLAEEVRDPSRGYPRALLGGLLVAGTIYLAVTLVASMAVRPRGWPAQTGRCSRSSGRLSVAVTFPFVAVTSSARAAHGAAASSRTVSAAVRPGVASAQIYRRRRASGTILARAMRQASVLPPLLERDASRRQSLFGCGWFASGGCPDPTPLRRLPVPRRFGQHPMSGARGGRGPVGHADRGLLRDRTVRALQRGADQHDHGLAGRVRDVRRGDPAARARPGASRAADAVGGDRGHHRDRDGADRLG